MLDFCFGVLCFAGCGGNSCETVECGGGEIYGNKPVGISIPGCGGCITPGKGCDSCLWAQSCKFITVSGIEESNDAETEIGFTGCDIRYYDGGCLGCGYKEQSCYSGCIKVDSDSEEEAMNGIVYGTSDGSEKYTGCVNGYGGCVSSDGIGRMIIREIEYLMVVE